MPHTHLLLQSISARPQSGNDSFLIRAAWHHREPRIEHCIRVPVPTRYQFFSNSSRVCALHDFCNNLYNSNWIKLLEKFILGLGVLQLFFFFSFWNWTTDFSFQTYFNENILCCMNIHSSESKHDTVCFYRTLINGGVVWCSLMSSRVTLTTLKLLFSNNSLYQSSSYSTAICHRSIFHTAYPT